MKKLSPILLLLSITTLAAAQNLPADIQIAMAVQAAPEDQRDGARVMGFSDTGELVVLREGSNELVCVADDPSSSGLNIACYHKDLEAFMQRGRDLRAEGFGRMEVFNMREEEVASGELFMPRTPTTLHILYGDQTVADESTGEITGAKLRWVIYIPYATAETTGLPLQPAGPGTPWLMDPGTHRAHIMVTPQ